jgi:hypothetical protein
MSSPTASQPASRSSACHAHWTEGADRWGPPGALGTTYPPHPGVGDGTRPELSCRQPFLSPWSTRGQGTVVSTFCYIKSPSHPAPCRVAVGSPGSRLRRTPGAGWAQPQRTGSPGHSWPWAAGPGGVASAWGHSKATESTAPTSGIPQAPGEEGKRHLGQSQLAFPVLSLLTRSPGPGTPWGSGRQCSG